VLVIQVEVLVLFESRSRNYSHERKLKNWRSSTYFIPNHRASIRRI